MSNTLPNEATTGYITSKEIDNSAAIQAYMEGLSPFERARFIEIAHHMVHLGFEEGMTRRDIEPNDDIKARVLVNETTLFMMGAGKLAEELGR